MRFIGTFVVLLVFYLGDGLAMAQAPAQPDVERDAFASATQPSNPQEKIKALEKFVKDYPSSSRLARAYSALFEAHLATAGGALAYADKAIAATPESGRPERYNDFAWSLAEKGVSLDRALKYASKAVDSARAQKSSDRTLAGYLDTRAWVKYKLGDFAGGEKDERDAIGRLSTGGDQVLKNVEFTTRLGLILEKSGSQSQEAADLLATGLVLGELKDPGPLDRLLARMTSEPAGTAQRKTELVRSAGERYIDSAPDKASARARVALGYARAGILVDEALGIARSAAAEMSTGDVEGYLATQRTLGVIYSLRNEPEAAVGALQGIAALASPFETDVFLHLGRNLERLGRDSEALAAYLAGTPATQPAAIMEPLTALYRKLNGSDAGFKERVENASREYSNFTPSGPPKKGVSGRVVLAELFTGAECRPCVAADQAFDHLLNVYPRDTVAVLQYHLHIPGPDPLTNPDTEVRAKYYAVRGTPTAVVGGTRSLMGGGPKSMARDRYGLYTYLIDRDLDAAPGAQVEVSSELNGGRLAVKARAEADGASIRDLRLRIALVQGVVHYTGANGWSEHRTVVRRMIGGPDGIPLSDGKAVHQSTVDLAEVSAGLRAYLENFEKNPPERFSGRKDLKFKGQTDAFLPGDLILVAFVQDDKTKEVLQAAFAPVTAP